MGPEQMPDIRRKVGVVIGDGARWRAFWDRHHERDWWGKFILTHRGRFIRPHPASRKPTSTP